MPNFSLVSTQSKTRLYFCPTAQSSSFSIVKHSWPLNLSTVFNLLEVLCFIPIAVTHFWLSRVIWIILKFHNAYDFLFVLFFDNKVDPRDLLVYQFSIENKIFYFNQTIFLGFSKKGFIYLFLLFFDKLFFLLQNVE